MTVLEPPTRDDQTDALPAVYEGEPGRGQRLRWWADARRDHWGPILRESFATRWWPVVSLFLALSSLATLTNSWGAYVGDNRFEQYWNPARRLARTLTIWDGSRGLGRVREEFWPAATAPMAVLRGIGFTPTVVEHLWHAALIAMVGLGMVAVIRLFQPRIGVEHVLAGLFVSFGAYSATFLLPSNLYLQYALAPWLFVVVFRGIHSERPWKWAAIFALITFGSGNVDTPGLIYACVPIVAVVAFALFVERSVRLRNVLGWFVRAGALSILVNVAMLAKTVYGAAALGSRLNDSESPEISAYTSSWAESFRGLGNWLSYFPNGNTLLKPQGEVYLTNWVVVLFSFVPPAVALFVLWRSRWRIRILYATTMIVALIVMVGAFPITAPSPAGNVILDAYANIKSLAAFRNTYKLGAGLLIGTGALAAYGIVLARRSVQGRSPRVRRLPTLLALIVIAGGAVPFWNGGLYNPNEQFQTLPTYYSQAFDYLARMPEDGRSLVLPQVSRTRYRWGWVGDDIFDALDARDHAIVSGVPESNQLSANVLEALTIVASDPQYRAGDLAPIMRRLGLTEIVLRNDIDWQSLSRPRPSAYDGLRVDPDFERIATFGRPGENTASPDDKSRLGDRDRSYAPVEIFQLRDRVGKVGADAPGAPLLVSGDGYAWAPMVKAGLLDNGHPLAYTGDMEPGQLAAALKAGSPLVVTDTNRRRLRLIVNYEPDYSHTLGPGQDLDRTPVTLWKDEHAQSTTWYPDATRISLTGPPRSVTGSHPWNRPSNAFDGDPTTLWTIGATDGLNDRVMRVDLRHRTTIASAHFLLPPLTPDGSGLRRAELRFSNGTTVPVDLTHGTETAIDFPPVETDFIELALTDVNPRAEVVGLADVTFPGLDLREFVQVPDDVFQQATHDQALGAAVATAPTGYLFTRSVQTNTLANPQPGGSATDEEVTLRRRFPVAAEGTYGAAGSIRLRSDTSDEVVDRLVGGDHGAFGTSREAGALAGYGGFAVDGDPNTSWLAPAEAGQALTLRFPRQTVSTIDLSSQYDPTSSPIDSIQVEVPDAGAPDGTRVVPADVVPSAPECDTDTNPAASCRRRAHLELDAPVETDHLTVRITKTSGREALLGGRIRVDEVELNGVPNTALFQTGTAPAACVDLGLRVAGADASRTDVRLSAQGTVADLLAGKALPAAGCDDVGLRSGWRTLDTDDHAPIDSVRLTGASLAAAVADPGADAGPAPLLHITSQDAHHVTASVDVTRPGSVIVFNQSFDKGWQATVNGTPIGAARPFNTVNGWVVDQTGTVTVELTYQPAKTWGWALTITAAGVALCLFLAIRRPRWQRVPHREAVTDG